MSEKKAKTIKISSIRKRKTELNHIEPPVIKNSLDKTVQFGDYLLDEEIEEIKEILPKEKKQNERHGYYISAEQWNMLNEIKDIEILKRAISVITNEVVRFEEGLCQYPSLEYGINIAETEINKEKREKLEKKNEYKKEDLLKIRDKFLSNLENN